MSKIGKPSFIKSDQGIAFPKDITGARAWVIVKAPHGLPDGLKITVSGEADRETGEVFQIARDAAKKITLFHKDTTYTWTNWVKVGSFNSWENPEKIILKQQET